MDEQIFLDIKNKVREVAGLDDDAQRRDTTVNAMYIPLTASDGANSKLIDPHGGIHHLRKGEIQFVGNTKERLGEDQLRAMRYIRQVSSYGKNTKITDDVKNAIGDIKDLPAVSRERIREEFLKGLKDEDIDPAHYIKTYKELGLLDTVFPGMTFKLDAPEDFSDKKEKKLAIAWLLRNNNPAKVEQMLRQGTWSNEEVINIVHLIELAKWASSHGQTPEIFFDKFYDMKKKYHRSGLVPSLTKEWGRMNKLPEDLMNKFINHNMDTKAYVDQDGQSKLNPQIRNYFGGRAPQGPEFGHAIKSLETDKFRKSVEKDNQDS